MDRKLFYRELIGNTGPSSIQSLYGSRAWVDNLDIVSELRGHTGCVNAISWSRSGALLASGSDDTQINIHTTTPDFVLNTRIDTGHTENIFSVKFMPHSSDRTLISAAGDSEVRIFDIEYAPSSSTASPSPPPPPPPHPRPFRRGLATSEITPQKLYTHYTHPHKVYTSHTDRVKRIVTESSPHVFLTCSEDGTVRQFDLRQPSAFYSRPTHVSGSQRSYFGVTLTSLDSLSEDEDHRNPPLISYRRHQIDLNTVSCSTSQPHYIALGGAHLHCFLHDRRMLGRDTGVETGTPGASSEAELTAATRCVRRFAPRPVRGGQYRGNPHITACKISDARPSDVVVSWSGGGIYCFDINRSPEPGESGLGREPWVPREKGGRVRGGRDRRFEGEPRSKRRRAEESEERDVLPGSEMVKIAKLVVDLRKEVFVAGEEEEERKKSWDAAVSTAYVLLKRINQDIEVLDEKDLEFFDENEGATDVEYRMERNIRRTRARNRRRTRAFVRAAGCLSRALGGEGAGVGAEAFVSIGTERPENSGFRYRFLQAAISLLDGGPTAVEELAREDQEGEDGDEDLEVGDMGRFLDALESEASGTEHVRDVTTNEVIFDNEKGMVRAFKGVVELGRENVMSDIPGVKDEIATGQSMRRFWGERVGRALLMKEGEGIDFAYVDSAFGGSEDEDEGDYPVLEDEDDDDEGESEEEGEYELGFGRMRQDIEAQAPVWEHTKIYTGHCNVKTVKDVNFYGMDDEYVVSGSDCGNFFIWDKKTTALVNLLRGDDEIVNVITGHPYEPKLAVSGIDYTVKIFSPDEVAQRQFQGLPVEGDDEEAPSGRRRNESRKRIQDCYKITSQNEVMTESGLQEAVHTRGMLALLAARLRERRAAGENIEEIRINAEQECTIM